MPTKRYQQTKNLRFITFSCYQPGAPFMRVFCAWVGQSCGSAIRLSQTTADHHPTCTL